ncbi:hypothetical protein P3S67_001674 [Capsicum chacoense]
MHVGPLHGSTTTHSASITMSSPSQYYRTTAGTSEHLPSLVPSTSSHPCSHSDSAGSIGLTDLHLRGTPSGASDPPTLVHPPALAPQPEDRDNYRRRFKPDAGVGKIITKCICQNFNDYWTSWQKVPEHDRKIMFKEFHKYYWWGDAHESVIRRNFYRRARSRFNGLLDYARTNRMRSGFILEPTWQDYIRYWNSDKCKLLIGLLWRKKWKKMGRKIGYDEIFEETHVREKKNPTDEHVWVEPRAKAAHDKYMQLVNEYRSTQPSESQGDTIPEDVEEELWRETVDPPVRGQYYGYQRKCFSENVRFTFVPTSYTSSDDRETVESLRNMASTLTEELSAQREMAKHKEEEITSQIKMLQQQFNSFIRSAGIIPPYPGDAIRPAKGLGPLDDISTDGESDPVCAVEDADDENDDDEW